MADEIKDDDLEGNQTPQVIPTLRQDTVILVSLDNKREAEEKGEAVLDIISIQEFNEGNISSEKKYDFSITIAGAQIIESEFSATLRPIPSSDKLTEFDTREDVFIQTTLTSCSNSQVPSKFREDDAQTVFTYAADRSDTSVIKELKMSFPQHESIKEDFEYQPDNIEDVSVPKSSINIDSTSGEESKAGQNIDLQNENLSAKEEKSTSSEEPLTEETLEVTSPLEVLPEQTPENKSPSETLSQTAIATNENLSEGVPSEIEPTEILTEISPDEEPTDAKISPDEEPTDAEISPDEEPTDAVSNGESQPIDLLPEISPKEISSEEFLAEGLTSTQVLKSKDELAVENETKDVTVSKTEEDEEEDEWHDSIQSVMEGVTNEKTSTEAPKTCPCKTDLTKTSTPHIDGTKGPCAQVKLEVAQGINESKQITLDVWLPECSHVCKTHNETELIEPTELISSDAENQLARNEIQEGGYDVITEDMEIIEQNTVNAIDQSLENVVESSAEQDMIEEGTESTKDANIYKDIEITEGNTNENDEDIGNEITPSITEPDEAVEGGESMEITEDNTTENDETIGNEIAPSMTVPDETVEGGEAMEITEENTTENDENIGNEIAPSMTVPDEAVEGGEPIEITEESTTENEESIGNEIVPSMTGPDEAVEGREPIEKDITELSPSQPDEITGEKIEDEKQTEKVTEDENETLMLSPAGTDEFTGDVFEGKEPGEQETEGENDIPEFSPTGTDDFNGEKVEGEEIAELVDEGETEITENVDLTENDQTLQDIENGESFQIPKDIETTKMPGSTMEKHTDIHRMMPCGGEIKLTFGEGCGQVEMKLKNTTGTFRDIYFDLKLPECTEACPQNKSQEVCQIPLLAEGAQDETFPELNEIATHSEYEHSTQIPETEVSEDVPLNTDTENLQSEIDHEQEETADTYEEKNEETIELPAENETDDLQEETIELPAENETDDLQEETIDLAAENKTDDLQEEIFHESVEPQVEDLALLELQSTENPPESETIELTESQAEEMPNSIEISQELETTPETEMAGPPEEALSEVKSTTSSEPKVEELSEITPAEIETGAEPSTQIEDSPASKENIQEVEYVEPLVDELPTDSMENPPESETIALSKDSEEKINIEANDQQTVEVDGLISQDTSECVTEERMPSSKQENMPEVKLTQPKLVDEICSGPCIKPQITQISGLEGDTGIALTVNEGQGKFQMTITGACEESKQINVNLWFPPCNEECKDTQAIIKEPQSAFQEEGNTDTSKKENESDEINTENEMKDEEMKDDDKQIAEEVIPFDIEIMEQNENEQTAEIEIDPIDTIDDGNLDTTIEHDEVEDNMPILTSESEPEKNNENDEEQIEFSPTDFEEERESKANAVLFQGEEISIMSEKQLSVDSSTEDIGTYKENEVCSGICAIGADIKISPSMIQKAIQGLSVIVGDGCGQAKLNLTKSDELSKVLHVGLEFLDCTELCPRCKSLAPQKKTYEDDDVTVCGITSYPEINISGAEALKALPGASQKMGAETMPVEGKSLLKGQERDMSSIVNIKTISSTKSNIMNEDIVMSWAGGDMTLIDITITKISKSTTELKIETWTPALPYSENKPIDSEASGSLSVSDKTDAGNITDFSDAIETTFETTLTDKKEVDDTIEESSKDREIQTDIVLGALLTSESISSMGNDNTAGNEKISQEDPTIELDANYQMPINKTASEAFQPEFNENNLSDPTTWEPNYLDTLMHSVPWKEEYVFFKTVEIKPMLENNLLSHPSEVEVQIIDMFEPLAEESSDIAKAQFIVPSMLTMDDAKDAVDDDNDNVLEVPNWPTLKDNAPANDYYYLPMGPAISQLSTLTGILAKQSPALINIPIDAQTWGFPAASTQRYGTADDDYFSAASEIVPFEMLPRVSSYLATDNDDAVSSVFNPNISKVSTPGSPREKLKNIGFTHDVPPTDSPVIFIITLNEVSAENRIRVISDKSEEDINNFMFQYEDAQKTNDAGIKCCAHFMQFFTSQLKHSGGDKFDTELVLKSSKELDMRRVMGFLLDSSNMVFEETFPVFEKGFGDQLEMPENVPASATVTTLNFHFEPKEKETIHSEKIIIESYKKGLKTTLLIGFKENSDYLGINKPKCTGEVTHFIINDNVQSNEEINVVGSNEPPISIPIKLGRLGKGFVKLSTISSSLSILTSYSPCDTTENAERTKEYDVLYKVVAGSEELSEVKELLPGSPPIIIQIPSTRPPDKNIPLSTNQVANLFSVRGEADTSAEIPVEKKLVSGKGEGNFSLEFWRCGNKEFETLIETEVPEVSQTPVIDNDYFTVCVSSYYETGYNITDGYKLEIPMQEGCNSIDVCNMRIDLGNIQSGEDGKKMIITFTELNGEPNICPVHAWKQIDYNIVKDDEIIEEVCKEIVTENFPRHINVPLDSEYAKEFIMDLCEGKVQAEVFCQIVVNGTIQSEANKIVSDLESPLLFDIPFDIDETNAQIIVQMKPVDNNYESQLSDNAKSVRKVLEIEEPKLSEMSGSPPIYPPPVAMFVPITHEDETKLNEPNIKWIESLPQVENEDAIGIPCATEVKDSIEYNESEKPVEGPEIEMECICSSCNCDKEDDIQEKHLKNQIQPFQNITKSDVKLDQNLDICQGNDKCMCCKCKNLHKDIKVAFKQDTSSFDNKMPEKVIQSEKGRVSEHYENCNCFNYTDDFDIEEDIEDDAEESIFSKNCNCPQCKLPQVCSLVRDAVIAKDSKKEAQLIDKENKSSLKDHESTPAHTENCICLDCTCHPEEIIFIQDVKLTVKDSAPPVKDTKFASTEDCICLECVCHREETSNVQITPTQDVQLVVNDTDIAPSVSIHPNECICSECVCHPAEITEIQGVSPQNVKLTNKIESPIGDALLSAENKFASKHTEECICLECVCHREETSNIQITPTQNVQLVVNDTDIAPSVSIHPNECICSACVWHPAEITEIQGVSPQNVKLTNKIESPIGDALLSAENKFASKPTEDCICLECVCHREETSNVQITPTQDVQLVVNDTDIAPSVSIHPNECICSECVCHPAEITEIQGVSPQNVKLTNKIESPIGDALLSAENKFASKHTEECICLECVCHREETSNIQITPTQDVQLVVNDTDIAPSVSIHPNECICSECVCHPAEITEIQGVLPQNVKLTNKIESPIGDALLSAENKFASKPTEDCICLECVCHREETSNVQITPTQDVQLVVNDTDIAPSVSIHPNECICSECVCHPAEITEIQGVSPQNVKVTIKIESPIGDALLSAENKFASKHTEECICLECVCVLEETGNAQSTPTQDVKLVINDIDIEPDVSIHANECICLECVCHPAEITQIQGGSPQNVKLTKKIESPIGDALFAAENEETATHINECICLECICHPAVTTNDQNIPLQEGNLDMKKNKYPVGDIESPPADGNDCICLECIYHVAGITDTPPQDDKLAIKDNKSPVGDIESPTTQNNCICLECLCHVAGITDVQGTPPLDLNLSTGIGNNKSPLKDTESVHKDADNCICLECICHPIEITNGQDITLEDTKLGVENIRSPFEGTESTPTNINNCICLECICHSDKESNEKDLVVSMNTEPTGTKNEDFLGKDIECICSECVCDSLQITDTKFPEQGSTRKGIELEATTGSSSSIQKICANVEYTYPTNEGEISESKIIAPGGSPMKIEIPIGINKYHATLIISTELRVQSLSSPADPTETIYDKEARAGLTVQYCTEFHTGTPDEFKILLEKDICKYDINSLSRESHLKNMFNTWESIQILFKKQLGPIHQQMEMLLSSYRRLDTYELSHEGGVYFARIRNFDPNPIIEQNISQCSSQQQSLNYNDKIFSIYSGEQPSNILPVSNVQTLRTSKFVKGSNQNRPNLTLLNDIRKDIGQHSVELCKTSYEQYFDLPIYGILKSDRRANITGTNFSKLDDYNKEQKMQLKADNIIINSFSASINDLNKHALQHEKITDTGCYTTGPNVLNQNASTSLANDTCCNTFSNAEKDIWKHSKKPNGVNQEKLIYNNSNMLYNQSLNNMKYLSGKKRSNTTFVQKRPQTYPFYSKNTIPMHLNRDEDNLVTSSSPAMAINFHEFKDQQLYSKPSEIFVSSHYKKFNNNKISKHIYEQLSSTQSNMGREIQKPIVFGFMDHNSSRASMLEFPNSYNIANNITVAARNYYNSNSPIQSQASYEKEYQVGNEITPQNNEKEYSSMWTQKHTASKEPLNKKYFYRNKNSMYVSGNNYSQAYHQKNTINSKNNYRDRINICPVRSNTTQKRSSKNATEKYLSNLAQMHIALSHNIKSAMLVDPIKQRYRPCSYPENKIYYQHGYNLSLKKNGFQLLAQQYTKQHSIIGANKEVNYFFKNSKKVNGIKLEGLWSTPED